MKSTSKKPSAIERTIGLFDGKMDLERKPGENRDGTALLERQPSVKQGPRWYGKGPWRYATPAEEKKETSRGSIVSRDGGYTAYGRAGIANHFDSIHDAANFVERNCR